MRASYGLRLCKWLILSAKGQASLIQKDRHLSFFPLAFLAAGLPFLVFPHADSTAVDLHGHATTGQASQNSCGELIGASIEMPLDFPFDSAKGAGILSQPLFPPRLTNLCGSAKLIHYRGWGTNLRTSFLQTNSHGGFLLPVAAGPKSHNMVGNRLSRKDQ